MDTDFSQDSGGQKSKAGVWAGLVPFEAALPGLQVADFSLYLFRHFPCVPASTRSLFCAHVRSCVHLSPSWASGSKPRGPTSPSYRD